MQDDAPDFGLEKAKSSNARLLEEGQWVSFQPSHFYKGATPVKAQVTKVWGPGCVNLAVSYPDGVRMETSVLVIFPGQLKPPTGYYCFPNDEVS